MWCSSVFQKAARLKPLKCVLTSDMDGDKGVFWGKIYLQPILFCFNHPAKPSPLHSRTAMAPITKRRKPNPTPVSVIEPTDGSATGFTAEAHSRALELIQACLDGEVERAKELVAQGADAWVQDAQGWSALHAAASEWLNFFDDFEASMS